MISVIVATCFLVFIDLGNASELYYATKVRNSVQAKAEDWKVILACFGQAVGSRQGSRHVPPQMGSLPQSRAYEHLFKIQGLQTVTWKYGDTEGSHVPCNRLAQDQATYMPDTTPPVSKFPSKLIPRASSKPRF